MPEMASWSSNSDKFISCSVRKKVWRPGIRAAGASLRHWPYEQAGEWSYCLGSGRLGGEAPEAEKTAIYTLVFLSDLEK